MYIVVVWGRCCLSAVVVAFVGLLARGFAVYIFRVAVSGDLLVVSYLRLGVVRVFGVWVWFYVGCVF